MNTKIIKNLKEALKGKKLVRLAHTIDEGLDQTLLDIPQEVWYKYPTMGEDFIKHQLEERGIKCVRPFPNSHRDRNYTYDHLIWKMIADGYINKMNEDPIFFCYKNSTNLDEVCEQYGFKQFMPDYKLFKDLQYKSNLEKFGINENMGLVPFFESNIMALTYEEICKKIGNIFVVQFSYNLEGWNTRGSRDTFIIETKKEYEELLSKSYTMPAKISKYIDGYSICINVINIEKGSVVSEPYLQVIGEPNLTDSKVILCGANFTECNNIPEDIKLKSSVIGKSIGAELYKKNFKGHFGVDLIVDRKTNNVYVIEINPRFTGTTFVHTLFADRENKLPFIALHLSEYLECLPESFNIDEYEKNMKGIWQGGAFYLRNPNKKIMQILNAPRPGIYQIIDEDIKYIKEEYTLKNIPEKDHFLISKVYPLKRNIAINDPLLSVYTLERTFDGTEKLTDKYINVVKKLYNRFKFVPAGTYDSSVPYKVI